MEFEVSKHFFEKLRYKISWRSVQCCRVVPCGRTDRDEANSSILQFCERACELSDDHRYPGCVFAKIYLQAVNTHTAVPDSTKLFLVNQFTCRTLAERGGHGATSSGDGRYSSEKMALNKKHCSRRVWDQRRMCLGRLCRYFLYWWSKSE
jgi:hypothetical protein